MFTEVLLVEPQPMGQPKLDAQMQREVSVPQGLPGSWSECPWFQQVCRCPRGFVSTWSGLHNPWPMQVCASGLLQVEQNLVAQVSVLADSTECWLLELVSTWEIFTMQSAFLQKWWERKHMIFAFQNLHLCTVSHLSLKIQHHPSEQLLLFLERLGKKHPLSPKMPPNFRALNWWFWAKPNIFLGLLSNNKNSYVLLIVLRSNLCSYIYAER